MRQLRNILSRYWDRDIDSKDDTLKIEKGPRFQREAGAWRIQDLI
jgi:hypothetical protein